MENTDFDEKNLNAQTIRMDEEKWAKILSEIKAFSNAYNLLKNGKIKSENEFYEAFYPPKLLSQTNRLFKLNETIKTLSNELNELKAELMLDMEKLARKSIKTGAYSVSYTPKRIIKTEKADIKALKKQGLDKYIEIKETIYKPSIRIGNKLDF
jgi:hypothetical protein